MQIGTWGPVTFEVNAQRVRTWQEMRRAGEARWATHEVFMGKPVSEFQGPGLDTISLQVRIDAALGLVPENELRDLREQRDIGAVQSLVLGEHPVGRFILKALSEEHRRHDGAGRLVLAIVALSFEEYV